METKRKLYIAAAILMVLVVALGLLTACSSESLVEYEVPAVRTAPTSYTLTVQATKGEAVTSRALSLDSGVLNASWTKDDVVMVYYADGAELGSLTAASSGVETMLVGTLTTLPANGDVLTLKFLSPEYASQGGTLDYIAKNCDYATASVTVLGIDGTDVTTTGAVFENQQSIVKFTLQDKDNSNAAISATEMIVVADGHTYTVQPSAATNEFFVALPSISNKNIQVTAANDTDMFNFVRENITIECGKYYTMTMQMDKFANKVVDLSTLTGNYVAMNGAVLTGTLHSNCQISIAAGASITLYNASINAHGAHASNTDWAGITCLGDATITLDGDNVVKGCDNEYPGIQAGGEDTTLTIKGTGSLTAMGGGYAAGIGNGYGGTCGNISIIGGDIIAKGGVYAAGIGSGYDGSCGNIIISGTAKGSATKGGSSPYDIGPGVDGTCGNVFVESNDFRGSYPQMVMVDLSTLNGNYEAKDGAVLTGTLIEDYQISIASGASITLYNASINASGAHAGITCRGDATITLVGTNVVNACQNNYPGIQAGGTNTTLTINGTGSLTATGGGYAAGIGNYGPNTCGNITISGGTITATGGDYAAGIGSAYYRRCGNITISGGNITATGGKDAAGIGSGSGEGAECGNITISGTASGSAKGGEGSPYDIGFGKDGTCGTVSVKENTISGTYPGQQVVTLASCTFTLNFYENYNENGGMNQYGRYNANASTIKVTVNSVDYASTGSFQNGSTVEIDLPVGTGMTLTITAPNTEYWDDFTNVPEGGSYPKADFSATITRDISAGSENNLGMVNLVRQKNTVVP